jgi:hypothetical protein
MNETRVKDWWNDTAKVKLMYAEEKLTQCHFVHHKSQKGWFWIETRPFWRQDSDNPTAHRCCHFHSKTLTSFEKYITTVHIIYHSPAVNVHSL